MELIKLADLKAGDKVFISRTRTTQTATVDRTTPTQIQVANRKYSRKTGKVVGDRGWQSPTVMPYCKEYEAARLAKDEAIDAFLSAQKALQEAHSSACRSLDQTGLDAYEAAYLAVLAAKAEQEKVAETTSAVFQEYYRLIN